MDCITNTDLNRLQRNPIRFLRTTNVNRRYNHFTHYCGQCMQCTVKTNHFLKTILVFCRKSHRLPWKLG